MNLKSGDHLLPPSMPVATLSAALIALAAVLVPAQSGAAGTAEAAPAPMRKPVEAGIGADSGLPLPRWVALASDRVNMRTGPGPRYPISWSYQRRGLPVEIVDEHEYWRQIREQDGTKGWVHKSMLTGKRSALVMGSIQDVRDQPSPVGDVEVQAEPGVQVRLLACRDAVWCEVQVAGRKGFMAREGLWGLYPGETFK
jgi:SH3-like domain-containing protein